MTETKVTADELLSGQLRNRQGGDPNDFSVAGTTNYVEQRKNMMVQTGEINTGAGGTVTVTFPVAFSFTPQILYSVTSGTAMAVTLTAKSATGFTIQAVSLLGVLTSGIDISWRAEGRL